jgi:hypothetical protein
VSDQRGKERLHRQSGEPVVRFAELDDLVLVEVIGVRFLDRMHRQRRRALPSGVELHPVISFKALE